MKTMRTSLFETNSSSMHSIVIVDNDKCNRKYTLKEMLRSLNDYRINTKNNKKEYKYYFDSDSLTFGRYPFRILSSFADKLRFVIASYCEQYCNNKDDLQLFMLRYTLERIRIITKNIILENVKNMNNHEFVKFHFIYDSYIEYDNYYKIKDLYNQFELTKDGKIFDTINGITFVPKCFLQMNLGSTDDHSTLIQSFLEKNNIDLETFLKYKKYIIIIDGDEYHVWDQIKSTGLINIKFLK